MFEEFEGSKWITKCLIDMVFDVKRGLTKVSRKAKTTKSVPFATSFMGLGVRGGGCLVGVA